MGIVINRGGSLTTIQDLGRVGYQNQGFAVSGAMDHRACRLANLLLDNAPETAMLEATLVGPKFTFTEPNCFVVTGADLHATINGNPMVVNQVYVAERGDIVEFPVRFSKQGVRSYIAFAGGLSVQEFMGSRSTYLKGSMGGFHGRALKTGDEIGFPAPRHILPKIGSRFVPEKFNEVYGGHEITIRVIMGPQDDAFTEAGLDTFLHSEYVATPYMDRMGARLEGPEIEHKGRADLVSDGIAFGAVQVPQNGKPIILMADRQSTGGYTKIATVISVDLPKIAQRLAGDKIRFQPVTVEQAQQLLREERRKIDELTEKWQ